MSDAVAAAVAALNERLGGEGMEGSIKFVIQDEGAVLIDGAGARADDGDADCTVTASADTFRALLEGGLDPTVAFMTGKIAIDGDMGLAMRLGTLLS